MSESNNTAAAPAPDDPFFSLAQDSQWNACIGRQGSEENYVDGYMEAALELVGAVIDKRNFGARDTLAMPILYTARHAVELTLKFAVDRLHECGAMAELAKKNHDIDRYWTALDAAAIGDAQIQRLIAALAPYVTSLHAIDEDGQQLRYAETQEGVQSLASKSVCNLELVRESLKVMGPLLNDLKYRVLKYAEERATGTYTRECSRWDLKEITLNLPPHAQWGEAEFAAAKQRVMERYKLSSNKFGDAVNVIKAHREFGALLGLDFPLAHLSDAHARTAVSHWLSACPAPIAAEHGIVNAAKIDASALAEHMHALESAVDAAAAELPLEAAAELEAIYYLGLTGGYCEHHDGRVALTITRYRQEGGLRDQLRHIIAKGTMGAMLANGLETLGRRALAAELRAMLPVHTEIQPPSPEFDPPEA